MDMFAEFDFAASRRLPLLATDHPCSRVHGHTFMVRVTLRGELDPQTGWLVDFGDVERALNTVRQIVDHQYLNDIEGLDNPTTEVIATWLWAHLASNLDGLWSIGVQEHPSRGVIYYGPDA